MSKRKDITGMKFGRLTAIKFIEYVVGGSYWLFKCDCGNEKVIKQSSVSSGWTKSCGCLVKEVSRELMRNIKRAPMTEETKKKIGKANKGRKLNLTSEDRKKWSEVRKGREPWNKGKTGVYSEEAIEQIRQSKTGQKHTEETKKRMSESHKGVVFSEEHRMNLSIANIGKTLSEETKQKISEAKKGTPAWNKGLECDEDSKKKMSESHKGLHHTEETKKKISKATLGENSANWKGGDSISDTGYQVLWREDVKYHHQYEHRIVMEDYLGRKLKANEYVHHIDGDKLNNNISNLQVMTPSEHSKLHAKLRKERKNG